MAKDKGGVRLRREVWDSQRRAFRRSGLGAWLAVLCYPAVLAMALALFVVSSLLKGQWPPAVFTSSFQLGLLVGGTIVGAAWWVREMAQVFGAGAERERKGAEGEELTSSVLRPLRRHGWRVVHDVEYPGRGNVDHLLIGPGGIIAVDSKYTSERLWVTPKAIGGSQRNHIGQAKFSATLAERALAEAGLDHMAVQPALVFWGPGAPPIEGDQIMIQNTLVLEGRQARAWRLTLRDRPSVLDKATVKSVASAIARLGAAASSAPRHGDEDDRPGGNRR